MSELYDNNPQTENEVLQVETPILEKHAHWILISIVTIVVLLTIVFFYSLSPSSFKNESMSENAPMPVVESVVTIACSYADDTEAYRNAVTKNNLDTCHCVEEEDRRSACERTVKDSLTYKNAVRQMDASLCEGLMVEERKEACKSIIASSVSFFEKENPQRLADMYVASHNEKAIEQYEAVLTTDSKNVAALINLTLSYAEKGLKEQEQGRDQTPYVEKALATIEKALAVDNENSEVYRAKAYAYEVKPDLKTAIQWYDKALEYDPSNIAAYAGKGHAERMLGMLEIALIDFKKAAELDTQQTHVFVYANICNLEYSRRNIEEAEKNCNLVVANTHADIVFKSEALQTLSAISRDRREYLQANNYLAQAIALTPNDANLYVLLSKLNIFEQKYTDAETNARKAIERSPTKALGYLALSQALYMEEKYQNSIEAAETGISLVEKDVSLLAPSKPSAMRDLYASISFNYRELGDAVNQEKYEQLANDAIN